MLIFFQQNIVLFFQEALYRKMTSGPKENGFGGNVILSWWTIPVPLDSI